MVYSLHNALLVAAATVASVAADTESGSGSPHGHTYAVNVTFCETQYPMAKCYDSSTPEGKKRAVDEGLQGSCQGMVGTCTGQWPDGRKTTKEDYDGHLTVALGPEPEKPLVRSGYSTYDTTDPAKPVRIAPTVMSHKANDVNKAMTVASGSCFPWAHSQSAPTGTDVAFMPLSARAWCGGSGDQPTVQFYKGGGCGEGTELGGENNKDDKGLLFWTPDKCGGDYDTAADKDGPFVALGAFSCVSVKDSFNLMDSCGAMDDKDPTKPMEPEKIPVGTNAKTIDALYTLATDVCDTMAGQSTSGYEQINGQVYKSTSICNEECSDMRDPVVEIKKDSTESGCPATGGKDSVVDGFPSEELSAEQEKCAAKNVNKNKQPSFYTCYGAVDDEKCDQTPCAGAFCAMTGRGLGSCITEKVATKEELEKGPDNCGKETKYGFYFNGVCPAVSCTRITVSNKCGGKDALSTYGMRMQGSDQQRFANLGTTSFRIKTMEEMKDDLPSRPINWVLWAIIIGVVAVVVGIIVAAVVCSGGQKGEGEAAVKPEPDAAPAAEETPAVEEAAPAAEE